MLRLLQRSPKAINAGVGPDDSEPTPLALLEFQSPTAAIIATPMPAMARYTIFSVTMLVFMFVLIATFKYTDEVVMAIGEVVSTAPTVQIQAFNPAIVSTVNVRDGQLVHRGDVLATLDPTIAAANLASLTQQEQGYAAQVAQLQAQENGKPYEPDPNNPASTLQMATYAQQVGQYTFTMDDYAQKIKELQTNIDGYNAQAAYYRQRLGVASNIEDMRKNLQQLQVGSRLDTLSATDDRLNMQSSLASAESSADASTKELASQKAERDGFDQQWKATISQQLATALNSLAQAQQALTGAKLNNQLEVLTAPQDAIVQTVAPISVGAVLQAGTTLMELIPVNAPLTIEADVDGADTGFIHPGDNVEIEFTTLPYIQYGMGVGKVLSVSPNSFNPEAASTDPAAGAPLPEAPTDLYYKATVSIDELNLHNTPPGFRLVPGMAVTADIKIGTHTIMQYFAHKIMPTFYESMHEP